MRNAELSNSNQFASVKLTQTINISRKQSEIKSEPDSSSIEYENLSPSTHNFISQYTKSLLKIANKSQTILHSNSKRNSYCNKTNEEHLMFPLNLSWISSVSSNLSSETKILIK